MAIFTLALGNLRPDIKGVPFIEFLAPGLIMMSILQQAFNHTSSSLLISKIQGNIVDILMPPISAGEMNGCEKEEIEGRSRNGHQRKHEIKKCECTRK